MRVDIEDHNDPLFFLYNLSIFKYFHCCSYFLKQLLYRSSQKRKQRKTNHEQIKH